MKKTFILPFCFIIFSSFSQDWVGVPIPADPGAGKEWSLQDNVSDDFNYTAPAANKGNTFLSRWDDFYHNAWTGPGLTTWARNHSLVEGGELKLTATRYLTNRVNAGAVHSNNTVIYPVYVEISAKIMNSVLSNAGWLLSADDTQEIDFMEGYGATFSDSQNADQLWYAIRMHLSHHVFVRTPFQDWQPSEFGNNTGNPSPHPTWITRDDGAGEINWKDQYHRYGVYWQDPTHLYYYIDGVLVTQREGMAQIDPVYHTNAVNPGDGSNDTRTGLNKAMDILFTVEDQDWRSGMTPPLTPTDMELADTDNHTLRVDWIRVYKPQNVASIDEWFSKNVQVQPNPFKNKIQLKSKVVLSKIELYDINGAKILSKDINALNDVLSTEHLAKGLYILKLVNVNEGLAYKKILKN